MGKKSAAPLRKRRPSKSADWARDQRIAEELAMTPRERVLQALALQTAILFAGAPPAVVKSPPT
jgi:hypothetical protein